ncbi:MAG: hypothetical protein V4819_25910 [Verrucomicrobiota bacterium]
MKISLAASLLILATGAVVGWQDRQQIAAIRTTRAQLAAEAAKLGVSSDPAQITRRERPVHAAGVKLSVAEVIGLAKEMENSNTTDGLNQQAVNALQLRILDSLAAWDPAGLKTLLAEIRTNPDLTPATRMMLGYSCTTVLAIDHPQAALEIFTSSPELFTEGADGMSLVCTALASWARNDLTAAIEWLGKNPQPFSDYAKSGIVSAAAEQDPQHAFQLITELELKDSNQAAWNIVESAKTFEEQTATLAGLREYLPTIQAGNLLDEHGKSYLRMLAAHMDREGIEAITRWISDSKLTPQELDPFLDGLANATNSGETGRWVEWLRQSLPAKQADRRIDYLIRQWASRDYQAAAQWAMTQPPGKDRDETLKNTHRNWPKGDDAGKDAFAKEHGIK